MAQELEAKFKVGGFRAVRKALRDAGATYKGTAVHLDRFFDTPQRKLYRGGRGLRLRGIRVLRTGPGGLAGGDLVTYKGKAVPGRRAKVRREVQTRVDDGSAMAEIFRSAGLDVFMTLEKRRASYELGRCLVELDELPMLGCFVEIEGPSERAIEAARRRLGLEGRPITESYMHLAASRCGKINKTCREITFRRCGECDR